MGATGGMLWEIWGRRKLNFACHGAALVVAFFSVYWLRHSDSEMIGTILRIFMLSMFLGACLDLVTIFAYVEANAQTVQFGYPGRLLLKPVNTVHLALTPMLSGGAALAALLAAWKWILGSLLPSGALNPLWLGAVFLSCFWWMQALGWSLPFFAARSLVLLLAATAHALVGMIPLTQFTFLLRWKELILAVMLASAILTATNGLKWMRQGRWEGPSRFDAIWRRLAPAFAPKLSRKFGSAFRAQFWLEWLRQGRTLPGMCFSITAVILPLVFVVQKQIGESTQELDFTTVAISMILLVPLMLSGAMGTAMARFDPVRPSGDFPIYISVRPMTNGDFVLVKLAVALVSSALTWLLMLVVAGLALALLPHGMKLPSNYPFSFVDLALACIPLWLLLVLFTWNNLVSGIAAGLTGRPWMIRLFTFCKAIAAMGLVSIIFAAKINDDFKEALLRWLPALLWLCLTGKIALSVVSFVLGLRRNAVTPGAIGWVVGGWLACGLFVAGYAGLICYAMNKPDLWLRFALAGFLLLPLADLAIAPLALAWNRHR